MTDSQKICAPKPVKAHSNIRCLKRISNLDKISYKNNNNSPLTPFKRINYKIPMSRTQHFKNDAREKKFHSINNKFISNYSNNYESFCKELEQDLKIPKFEEGDSQFKSEIFSILKLEDSTNFGSHLESFQYSQDSFEGKLFNEIPNFKKIPDRSKNPFHKNFQTESQNKNQMNLNLNLFMNSLNTTNSLFENYFIDDVIESIKISDSEK